MLDLEHFEEACDKVKEVTLPTKLIKSDYFSEQTGNQVYIKPENMQLTGAYKIRGAYYKISQLSDEERERGLITALLETTRRVWLWLLRNVELRQPLLCQQLHRY